MGETTSKTFTNNFQKNYQFFKEVKDLRFGFIQIFKNKKNNEYIMLKAIVLSGNEKIEAK